MGDLPSIAPSISIKEKSMNILVILAILMFAFIAYKTLTRKDKSEPWWEYVMRLTAGSYNP